MRRIVALAWALAATPAFALSLGEVAAALGGVESSRARFVELRTVAALGTPIERRGMLAWRRPGTLEMVVESPVAERLSIADGKLTIESRGTTRVVDLARQEPLFAWIEGMRATLAGDEAALRRHFEPAVTGSIDRWSLSLVPRDARLRSIVARISIAGERERILSIEVDETSGDRSVMTILPLAGAAPK